MWHNNLKNNLKDADIQSGARFMTLCKEGNILSVTISDFQQINYRVDQVIFWLENAVSTFRANFSDWIWRFIHLLHYRKNVDTRLKKNREWVSEIVTEHSPVCLINLYTCNKMFSFMSYVSCGHILLQDWS